MWRKILSSRGLSQAERRMFSWLSPTREAFRAHGLFCFVFFFKWVCCLLQWFNSNRESPLLKMLVKLRPLSNLKFSGFYFWLSVLILPLLSRINESKNMVMSKMKAISKRLPPFPIFSSKQIHWWLQGLISLYMDVILKMKINLVLFY